MQTRRTLLLALTLSSGVGVAVLAACTSAASIPGPSSTSPARLVEQSAAPAVAAAARAARGAARQAAPPDVYLEVLGRCSTADGVLRARSHGFTPGGTVTVSATLDDGVTDYPRLSGTFPVAANGSVQWRWSCAGTPPGRYLLDFTDPDADSGSGLTFGTTLRVEAA